MKPQRERAPEPDELAELIGGPVAIGFEGPLPSIDELIAEGDAERLLELGAAHRVGTPKVERDAFKALECFEAASRLGSADAEHLIGVAYMDGIGIAADLAEGAKRLRSAAQRGSLRAKIYVANLYEMGVYYQADREKADVWYRNVARAAGIEADPATEAHDLAMAEIGCVRHALALVADDALSAKDRAFYLKKAKAMGYHHRLAQAKRESKLPAELASATSAPTPEASAVAPLEAPEPAERDAKLDSKSDASADEKRDAKSVEKRDAKNEEKPDGEPPVLLGAQWTWGPGLGAFVAALFFVSASTTAGWLAMEGSRALASAGRPLPFVGGVHEAVFFAVLFALGVLPATATYRARVVAIACATGAATAAGGHYLWDLQHLAWDRLAQSVASGLAGFLLVLLFLGLLGGTRARIVKASKRRPKATP